MKETLLVVESPAKAKTIGKYLGEGFHVVASVGHIRDLPKSNKDAVDIENDFAPRYVITPGKEHVVEDIRRLADAADRVLLATDPDREGEAIAWHIAEAVGLEKRERVAFHEITAEAVREAVEHPRDIDAQLVSAQEARRVLDRLVGYDLSGVLWQKVRYGLSAGRVQSPALRIIVEREREIKAFKPEPYWVISAKVETPRGDSLTLNCDQEPKEENAAGDALAAAKKGPWKVSEVKESTVARTPKPPFTTSTLQQAASTRLGISPAQTMRLAQKLYEAGHITYMRTDSVNLSAQAAADLAGTVEKNFGKELAQARTFQTKSKNAQEAHEAIRPTRAGALVAGNAPDQKKLYGLIWSRAVASQMKDASTLRTKVTAEIGGGNKLPTFSANGSRIVSPGWLLADPAARGEDVELPLVKKDEALKLISADSERKETTPPPRYSEAGLVRELEDRGIGRPSTYASIIKTLVDRTYATRESRSLAPTDLGEVVSGFLEAKFPRYVDDGFTAEMENELDEIAEGKRRYAPTLKAFYDIFRRDVAAVKKEKGKATDLGEGGFPCPVCGEPTVVKLGRQGRFLSCVKFPKCMGIADLDGKQLEREKPKELGLYPDTGERVLLLNGPYGPFVQVGETPAKKKRGAPKPKRASVPAGFAIADIVLADALKWLRLPKELGENPKNRKPVVAAVGRFGPYVGCDGEFRSVKPPDDIYEITLDRALELLAQPKKSRGGTRTSRKA
ncbi:MAG TPA: type I DNA topoisomerase [Candidatus Paceibacterota bacterium]